MHLLWWRVNGDLIDNGEEFVGAKSISVVDFYFYFYFFLREFFIF
jgi:hypothetical protein